MATFNSAVFSIDKNGNLLFENEIIGNVKGLDGVDGVDGKNGMPGLDGKNGMPGLNGINGINGVDGSTPYIGSNGNWWINSQDTGYFAGIQIIEENTFIETLTPTGSTLHVYEYSNGWNNRTLTSIEVIEFTAMVDIIVDLNRLYVDAEYYEWLINNGYPTNGMQILEYKYRISYDLILRVPDNFINEMISYNISESGEWYSNQYSDDNGIFETHTIMYVNDISDIGIRMYLGEHH